MNFQRDELRKQHLANRKISFYLLGYKIKTSLQVFIVLFAFKCSSFILKSHLEDSTQMKGISRQYQELRRENPVRVRQFEIYTLHSMNP